MTYEYDLPERVNDPDYYEPFSESSHYDPPDDRAGAVFDPSSPVFGPIMAAIQAGDFAGAAHRLEELEGRCAGVGSARAANEAGQ